MANAAMAHFGLDPGRFVRWMGGEYTGQLRDAHSTLAAVKGHVSIDDYDQISGSSSMDAQPSLTLRNPSVTRLK